MNFNTEIEKIYHDLRNYAFYLTKFNYLDSPEDLLHDAILKILEKKNMFSNQTDKTLEKWGASIMHNLYIDQKRKKYLAFTELKDLNLKVEDSNDKRHQRNICKEIKGTLKKSKKEQYLQFFILRSLGYSYLEIADYLHIPESAVKGSIYKMKQYLINKIQKEKIFI